MKVAVIGAGVAGLGAAWLLSRQHDVVIYERESRFGGHACTVDAPGLGRSQPVDVGFIVFNQRNYPNLVALFDHLGVPTKPSDMSFAVSLEGGRFEYGSSFASFLAQRRNMVRPSFLRMTHDILRFNRLAPRLPDKCEDPGALRAVLCEVNNTFGESHCYLVHHDDRRPIEPDTWLEGRKVFHVSPFLPVEGGYRFRFRLDDGRAHVDVNYHDAQELMLATSVGGRREALTDAGVLRRFLGNPTMTLAVIFRIHWQALHLLCKRARFHRKPAPPAELVTR